MPSAPQNEVVAIVLAAGAGRRVGTPKAHLPFEGGTFLQKLVRTLHAAGLTRVVVVLGAQADRQPEHSPLPASVTVVHNEGWERGGMISSLRRGLEAAGGASGALVWPVDHPAVRAQTVSALVDAFTQRRAPIVVPVHRGQGGHPVLFSSSLFAELREAPLDQGARAVVSAHQHQLEQVEVDDPGVLLGVDHPEDLQRLQHHATRL